MGCTSPRGCSVLGILGENRQVFALVKAPAHSICPGGSIHPQPWHCSLLSSKSGMQKYPSSARNPPAFSTRINCNPAKSL